MGSYKINEPATRQFLSLLNSGLWDREADMTPFRENGGPDWKGILEIAGTQAVVPLIYDGMMTLPQEMRPKGTALLKIIAYVDKVEMLNGELDAAAVEISGRLAAGGIRSVLLKGQGIAALYSNPGHRQCGDIDLYVGRKAYGKALELMRSWKEIHDEHQETVKHTGFMFGRLTVELHKEAFCMPDEKLDASYKVMEDRELAKDGATVHLGKGAEAGDVIVPVPAFNIFYVFCHAFHHFMEGGLGLRQMCDLAILLHKYHGMIDLGEYGGTLKTLKLDKEWQLFMGLLVDMLGLPAEEAPFYGKSSAALSRKLLEEMLGDGNFGHHKSLPDFSHLWKPLRKLGNLGIHHVLSARRLKYSPRHTLMYYRKMWKDGLANAFR